jgi:hypothetical protein
MLDTFESDLHYCIQIFADYIGILFKLPLHSELVILNWKTGRTELVSISAGPFGHLVHFCVAIASTRFIFLRLPD